MYHMSNMVKRHYSVVSLNRYRLTFKALITSPVTIENPATANRIGAMSTICPKIEPVAAVTADVAFVINSAFMRKT